jgi:predicted acetyltransferase
MPVLDAPSGAAEIRTARPEDEEQAWKLQHTAFSLEKDAPPPHPGSHEELRVVVRGGKVVSCLTLIHAELSLKGVDLPMGGIRHVATHPEEQNQGYASALMRDTLRKLRAGGILTTVLFPFSFRYYRKFGYELGGNHCQFWCRPNCIPAYAERRECRRGRPDEGAALARFYRERSSQSVCSMARDERRWNALCGDPAIQAVIHEAPGHEGTGIDGYVLLAESRDSYGGRVLRVLDLAADGARAWRALVGYLSQAPVESVEWYASAADLAASRLMHSPAPLREGFKPRGIVTVRPMFQFRVVDVEAALRARAAAFPEGTYRLALRVTDDLLPENEKPLAVHGLGERGEVRRAGPADPCLEGDIRIFSQIFCGYMSPSEAVSQGLARCPAEALETADRLFPSGEPFISELDRF